MKSSGRSSAGRCAASSSALSAPGMPLARRSEIARKSGRKSGPFVEQCLLFLVELVEEGRALLAAQRRADQHERRRARGVRESKVQRHAFAERVPDHRRPLDPEMVEGARRSSTYDPGPPGRADSPKPRRSRRTTRWAAAKADRRGVELDGGQRQSSADAWRARRANVSSSAQATCGWSSTKGRNSHGVSP